MSTKVLNLNCPGCGAAVTPGKLDCDYCARPIVVSSFSDLSEIVGPALRNYASAYSEASSNNPSSDVLLALGICQLKLGQFSHAKQTLSKATSLQADNSDAYFYNAVALLEGKKAFLAPIATIRESEELLNSAVALEARGYYFLFLAYLAYDFYERKFLNCSPNFSELIEESKTYGLSNQDTLQLKETLGITKFGFPMGEFD